jgi:hypothetical protein
MLLTMWARRVVHDAVCCRLWCGRLVACCFTNSLLPPVVGLKRLCFFFGLPLPVPCQGAPWNQPMPSQPSTRTRSKSLWKWLVPATAAGGNAVQSRGRTEAAAVAAEVEARTTQTAEPAGRCEVGCWGASAAVLCCGGVGGSWPGAWVRTSCCFKHPFTLHCLTGRFFVLLPTVASLLASS